MKESKMMLVALCAMAIIGCGNTNNNTKTDDNATSVEYDLRSIGAVDCLVDEYGGSIYLNVLIKNSGVDKSNIKIMHKANGSNVGGISRPLIAEDGENYEIIANVDVAYNKTEKVIEHKLFLFYFSGDRENIYAARCLQPGQSKEE